MFTSSCALAAGVRYTHAHRRVNNTRLCGTARMITDVTLNVYWASDRRAGFDDSFPLNQHLAMCFAYVCGRRCERLPSGVIPMLDEGPVQKLRCGQHL